MKPTNEYCKKYCDLYDECNRTECNRKPLLKPDKIVMVEQKEYDRYRIPEIKRAWKEQRVTKVN